MAKDVAVRNLFTGDVLVGGDTIQNIWANSKTPKGKRDLMVKGANGKVTRRTWNAGTIVKVANR